MQRAQGFAQQGAQLVWTAGNASATQVQESAPFAMILVYLTGTTTLATIYADNNTPPTPLANPFTANDNGYWFFYAADGRYDIMIEAENWTWTIGDVMLGDSGYSWIGNVQANGNSLLGLFQVQTQCVELYNPNAAGTMTLCFDTDPSNNPVAVLTSSGPTCYLVIEQTQPGGGGVIFTSAGVYQGEISAWNSIVTIFSANKTAAINVTPSGQVGIGTNSPNTTLQVVGPQVSGVGLAQFQGSASWAYVSLNTAVAGGYCGLEFRSAGTWIGSIESNNQANVLNVWTDVSKVTPLMTFTPAGFVGILNTTPAYALDVTGDVNCTGTFRVNGTPVSLAALETRIALLEARVK